MAIILPNAAKVSWLQSVLGAAPPMTVHLFDNAISVGDLTVIADFNEASFAGYSPQNLSFGGVFIDVDSKATAIAATQTYTLTSGTAVIYGAWGVDVFNSFMWCALFATPVALSTGTPDLRVTVTLKCQTM